MGESPKTPEVFIRLTSVDDIRRHGEGLFRRHAEESEPDLAEHLEPDWGAYLRSEAADDLIVLGAWAGQELVGYAVAWLFFSPRYSGRIICQQDLIFVAPEWRGGKIGVRLIRELRSQAMKRGASQLLTHAKPGTPLEELYKLLGFQVEETVFKEELCQP